MNEDYLRKSWTVGDKVEIYSLSKNNWFPGKIVDIFIDEEGEWLEIKYNKTCSKQVQRYSINVRPHPKYYDEERTKLLLDGYLRMLQYEHVTQMIPLHVHVAIFQFYFLGVATLSDDDSVSSSDSEPDDMPPRIRVSSNRNGRNVRRIRLPRFSKLRPSTYTYPATKRVRQNQQLSDIPELQPMHDIVLPLYVDHPQGKPPMFALEQKLEDEDDYDDEERHKEEEQEEDGVQQQEEDDHDDDEEEEEEDEEEQEVDENEEEEDEMMDTTMQMVESSPSPSDSPCQALQGPHRQTDWRLDVQRDAILVTMSELVFEMTPMFKVVQIQSLSSELQKQLVSLKQSMAEKKEYRKELLIFGYIRYIQVSIANKVIPIEVKKLCLLYYSE